MYLLKKSFRYHILQAGNHFAEFSNSVFPPDVLQMQLAHQYHMLFLSMTGRGGRSLP